jgi:hypothetical protein
MRTCKWSVEKAGEGKYHVRLKVIGNDDNGNLIPGLIIGAPKNWFVQIGGNQWPTKYRTRNDAAEALVRHEFGI